MKALRLILKIAGILTILSAVVMNAMIFGYLGDVIDLDKYQILHVIETHGVKKCADLVFAAAILNLIIIFGLAAAMLVPDKRR